jgi:uncharacterized membrane protein YkoI
MNKMSYPAIALAGVLCLGAAVPAFAAGNSEAQEQTALQNSKITLSQAIATAEQQTGGKAYDAGVDVDHGKAQIAVETNGPKGVQTVTIDAQNGQVIGTRSGGEAD